MNYLPSNLSFKDRVAHIGDTSLLDVGKEYGTTTGRPRRIGWLDTVVLRHTKRTSGLSYLAVTLLDVLSGIDELKIAVSYDLNGKELFSEKVDLEEGKNKLNIPVKIFSIYDHY